MLYLDPRVALQGDFMSYHAASNPLPLSMLSCRGDYPGLMPGWDNTARRGANAYGFVGANPLTWRGTLSTAVIGEARRPDAVFVNAWNEWAERATLEPDRRFGAGFLMSNADVRPQASSTRRP